MSFETLIKEKIEPLLKDKGFSVVEYIKNIFRFEHKTMEISVSFNEPDKECMLLLGIKNEFMYPVSDKALKEVFGMNLSLTNVTTYDFTNNLVSFFSSAADYLTGEDLSKLYEFRNFCDRESKLYTDRIIWEGILNKLNNAWTEKRYVDFIKLVEITGKDTLPDIVIKKYEIAKKHL